MMSHAPPPPSPLDQQLMGAAACGDAAALRGLLQTALGDPTRLRRSLLDDPLLAAVRHSQVDAARLLLEHNTCHRSAYAHTDEQSQASEGSHAPAGGRRAALLTGAAYHALAAGQWQLLPAFRDSGLDGELGASTVVLPSGEIADEELRLATLRTAWELWPPCAEELAEAFDLAIRERLAACLDHILAMQEEAGGERFSKALLRDLRAAVSRGAPPSAEMAQMFERRISDAPDE